MTPTRRTFLLAATAAASLPGQRMSAAADAYDTLRHRWLTIALGDAYDPTAEPYATRLRETGERARAFRATMAPTTRSLWPDHPFDPPAGITQSYGRLWTMTEAYTQPGTGSTGDTGLLADVLRGLGHLSATVYNPSTTRYGNWWEWQIGSPRLLMDIVAALYDRLTPAQRDDACAAVDHFIPDALLRDYTGTSTGANRVDLCRSVALRGILGRAPEKIALARDALSPVFPYVTQGDGLYADGSFVQHTWVAYSGTYGQVLLDGLGRLFALLAGSTWEVTDPNRQIVLDSVERAYAPLLYDGLVMDSVNGRAISRGHLKSDDRHVMRSDHFHGQGIIAAIALLALGATAEERRRWYGRVKGWMERDTVTPILTARQFGVADLARLHTVAASPVPAAPEPVGHRLFAAMDRAVHRRPGFAVNIAMASDRIAHYECGNGENPRGWHTGAGLTLWWAEGLGGRADQYTDWFWPTVDWYRLPGTTVSTKRLADREGGEWGAPKPAVRWVGGTTDGEYAAIGQHLKGLGSTLEAHKSWFCVADSVICLGAGISCTDGVPVETVVDNRNLGEPTAPTASSASASSTAASASAFVRGHGWAHLEGHGGWVLPEGGTLRALREDRTGAWSDINTGGTTERRTRRWQTLWLDHGADPTDAAYVYVLMPGASRRAVAARAADRRWLSVLANDRACQAIHVQDLGVTAANFWGAGTAGPLTVSAGASVLLRRGRGTATLCVSEPPRTGGPIEITYAGAVRSVLRADDSVEVLAITGRRLRLRVTPGTACATHTCELTLTE
ncbi:polysaccharide lyase 8 family protein [Streptomyces ipomoeae]|uniref:Tat pathway signal sequence domain protein n=1 Tax=Streptomyces ipomoeae 91-03 TaxID=698759 RepID=L1KZA4_9ACTN|nr:polysaccharide lyase 8 family protein [Streptomyces ipomoeae]EKX65688.1 Tat pathway signal sequence domain protein [Streptomyces ipomoeae 91-03]MDX2692732.1 polysaccharide lyase 8 family protein [Streptomyces ipomoeae]MDX2824449.1 polysaccharide lyase 8 family protein [Streptomyces ipomoeae]MDX2838256.1 polysaccharide lyase 8 family protein [Streptomyces ipomoeae]MDX2873020.1 polysaccharide lyase 8 family protein [Streptomyces ipomoeae]